MGNTIPLVRKSQSSLALDYVSKINLSLWECKGVYGKGKELLNQTFLARRVIYKTYITSISVRTTSKCLICWASVK
jgi:hypothetical protein